MQVIIGVDPHKASHTAVAIDTSEAQLDHKKVRAARTQVDHLLRWAKPYPARLWAIEGANGMGYLLAQQLVAAGEHVVNVPATLASRTRLLGTGRTNKNDRTTPCPLRSPRCAAAPCTRSGPSGTAKSCACWPSGTETSAPTGPGRSAGCTRCSSTRPRRDLQGDQRL